MGLKKGSGKGVKTSILILIVLISVYLFLHSSIFNINKIDITGNEKVSKDEILALAGIKPGAKLFSVDKDIVSKSIAVHPLIKTVSIERQLPDTIAIKVIERKIWAIIPYEENFLCVDDEGVCIDKVNNLKNYNSPIITLDKLPARVNYGQAIEADGIKMIKQIWQAIPDNNRLAISDFHLVDKDHSLIIYTVKGTQIKFGNIERLEEKVNNLNQVIKMESDMEIEGKEILEYVDLRFENQPAFKTKV